LLIVGCGDIGLRVARALPRGVRVLGLTSSPARVPDLRARGITPLRGDLDAPASLARLAGIAHYVVHLAPPPSEPGAQWWRDLRMHALLRALRLRSVPGKLVYASTTGVYGDCAGARVSESRPAAPHTPRAQRRVDAERQVRFFARGHGTQVSVLRDRLLKGTPVLAQADDVYTNHIHGDDLARAVIAALWRGRPQRVYNITDDTELKMGDYFDLAADLYGLPRPPRLARSSAQEQLPLMLLSFMGESRRLDNTRMKQELRVALRHPTVASGLAP
jgi:nucleoside-diphosphate-sugar epimerase